MTVWRTCLVALSLIVTCVALPETLSKLDPPPSQNSLTPSTRRHINLTRIIREHREKYSPITFSAGPSATALVFVLWMVCLSLVVN